MFHMPQKKISDFLSKIDNVAFEHVNTFNFLCITLHVNLKYDSHVNNILNKIARVISTLNRLMHCIPSNIMPTLYNSLILTHLY